MPAPHRRVILKPEGISEADASELARRLAAAVQAQKQLAAKSQHVLQFIGELQENEHAFFIEHEPAQALPADDIFDRTPPELDFPELLRITGAFLDALRVGHSTGGGRPTVHGGITPAAITRTSDDIDKITDFGFAQAVCGVLGVDSYINLAIKPRDQGPSETHGTGVWEVLAADESERDDRICAFVDPDQYGTQVLDTFESGSDIVAVGFVLHLLAEHVHPYLPSEAEAHRYPEMSEFMAMTHYNGARRPELRNSDDPGIKLWCNWMEKILSRIPRDRPSASDVWDAIKEHVPQRDPGEAVARKLEEITKQLDQTAPDQIDWEQVRAQVEPIAASEVAPTEVVQRAAELIKQANANLLITKITQALQGDDWAQAQQPLDEVLALEGLPTELAQQVQDSSQTLQRYIATRDGLKEIHDQIPKEIGRKPVDTRRLLKSLSDRADELPADESLPQSLQTAKAKLREELSGWEAKVDAEIKLIEEALAAARAQAQEYLTKLESVLDAGQWEQLQELLDKPPDIKPWPDDVQSRIADIRKRLAEHIKIEADHQAAQAWIEEVRDVVDSKRWDDARKRLDDRPNLTHWPEPVLTEVDKLAQQVDQALRIIADHKEAKNCCRQFEEAFASEDLSGADEILERLGKIKHKPDDVVPKEAHFRELLKTKISEIEAQRQRKKKQQKQIQAWFKKFKALADRAESESAIDMYAARPDVPKEIWPEGLWKEAEELDDRCRAKFGKESEERIKNHLLKVEESGKSFISTLIKERFKTLVDPGLLETTVPTDELTPQDPTCYGRATFTVRMRDPAGKADDMRVDADFKYREEGDQYQICDDDGSLRKLVTTHLTEILTDLQAKRLESLVAPLSSGVFPKASIQAKLTGLSSRTNAKIGLTASKTANPTIEAEITWSPTDLTWGYADAAAFTRQAWEIAAKAADKKLRPLVIEKSKELQRYKSAVTVDMVSTAPTDPAVLSRPLTMDVQLTIRPGGDGDAQILHTLPATCPQVGVVSIEADLAPAEATLRKIVTAAQKATHETITNDLRSRIKAESPKVKLALTPAQITDPVDNVTFRLKARGHEALTLQANWDTESFAFRPAAEWDDPVGKYLQLPVKSRSLALPAAIVAVPLIVVAVAYYGLQLRQTSPTPPPDGPEVDPVEYVTQLVADANSLRCGQVRRRIENLPAEADTWPDDLQSQIRDARQLCDQYLARVELNEKIEADAQEANTWIEGVRTAVQAERWEDADRILANRPQLEHWPADVNEAIETYDAQIQEALAPTPEPSLTEAIDEVKTLLASSPHLQRVISDNDKTLVRVGRAPGSRSLQFRVPGVTDDWQSVYLDEAGQTARLLPPGPREIQNRVVQLDQLLSATPTDAITPLVRTMLQDDSAPPSDILDPSVITVIARPPTGWQVTPEYDAWTGQTTATLQLNSAQPKSVAITDIALKMSGGSVSVTDQRNSLPSDTNQGLLAALLELQNESIGNLLAADATNNLRQAVQVPTTYALNEPQAVVQLPPATNPDGVLTPRTITAHWDPTALLFDTQRWSDQADEIRFAYDVIQNLTNRTEGWIKAGSNGAVIEQNSPDRGDWRLAVRADWDADLLLPIPTNWRTANESVIDLADRILTNDKPDYWTMIEIRKRFLDNAPGPLPPEYLTDFAEALRGDNPTSPASLLAAYLGSDRPLAVPAIEITLTNLADAGNQLPSSLQLSFDARWGLAADPLPAPIDRDKLTEKIRTLSQTVRGTLNLNSTGPGVLWTLSSPSTIGRDLGEVLPRLGALKNRLDKFDDRVRLENDLQAELAGLGVDGGQIDQATAMTLLKRIWALKGTDDTPAAGTATLKLLSSTIRTDLNDARFWTRGSPIPATVFAEYFCGPNNTYAIAWGYRVDNDKIHQQPTLRRVCANAQLGQGDLGTILLGNVLHSVESGITADDFDGFMNVLGLVLAPDDRMSVGLANQKFAPVTSRFDSFKGAGAVIEYFDWDSLWALENNNDVVQHQAKAGYRLVPALSVPAGRWDSDPARNSAIAMLDECMREPGN